MGNISEIVKMEANKLPMDRERCEEIINRKFREIVDVYHEYNPGGNYLTISYLNEDNDGYVTCNNRYHAADEETGEPAGEDFEHPISFTTYGKLKIEEGPAHSSAFKEMLVTGFTSEQFEEIKRLHDEVGKSQAEDYALEILDKRNGNTGSCWANGYGVYGFHIGKTGCVFVIGNSCD